jgi:hypothetical protein
MDQQAGGRRRIDRVTAPDLLADVDSLPAAVLRALRDECREEEARLSYARRVAQGQLDIARTELRRRDAGTAGTQSLVEQLATILADEPSGANREARTVGFYAPTDDPARRDGDDASLPALGQLPDLDVERIETFIGRLEAEELRLSELRRVVLDHLDGLQSELVRRYREGDADLATILSDALPERRGDGAAG